MDLGLTGARALVSASSRGLGRACAAALAAEGARVVISSRSEEALAATAAGIGAEGWVAADVSRRGEPERLVAAAVAQLGGLDILVVNAGGPRTGTFSSTPPEAWDAAYDLTLMSMVRLAHAALPHLRQSGRGRIVNLTSGTVREPIANLVLSNAFRSALTSAAKTLSREVAAEGVTVNNIAPGRILTDRIDELDAVSARDQGLTVEDVRARSIAGIPAGRLGRPEEFGAVCAFLCSTHAAYITGQTIAVDGGQEKGVF